jgi:YidC/Oxa1 family membrane protein insertase
MLVGGLQSGLLRLYDLTEYIGVPSFGIAIILFTVIVRLILFPLSVTSLRSSRRMQLLSPHLKEMQRQHKGDRQAMAQAQMELYKEHGVNPLMGCLPQLAQLPILFALYWAIIGVTNSDEMLASLEMAFLWISNLAEPDVWLPPGVDLPFKLPGILALTAGATQWVVQRMMMNRMTTDPQQQMIQNVMQFMPIMIVFFAMQFPAGLALYWVVSNIFSIGQQWVIMRDKSLKVPVPATAVASPSNTSATPKTTKSSPAAPAADKQEKPEATPAPASPKGTSAPSRTEKLFGGLSLGGSGRTSIPELTETTLQELGFDDADDKGRGASDQAPKTRKSRPRSRERKKGGGKR